MPTNGSSHSGAAFSRVGDAGDVSENRAQTRLWFWGTCGRFVGQARHARHARRARQARAATITLTALAVAILGALATGLSSAPTDRTVAMMRLRVSFMVSYAQAEQGQSRRIRRANRTGTPRKSMGKASHHPEVAA